MGLFSSSEDQVRKANLSALEDKRLRFLDGIQTEDDMLLTVTELGSLRALGIVNGNPCAIIAPELGSDKEYRLIALAGSTWRKESFFEAGTGLSGAFGIGTKGGEGFTLIFETAEGEWAFPYIYHKNSCLICAPKRNPLLVSKRRRGDSNPAWEVPPMERKDLKTIEKWLNAFLNRL